MNIIIRFTKFKLTLYSVLRFESTVVVMADQNLLDAINVGEKRLLDTISIDKISTVISVTIRNPSVLMMVISPKNLLKIQMVSTVFLSH